MVLSRMCVRYHGSKIVWLSGVCIRHIVVEFYFVVVEDGQAASGPYITLAFWMMSSPVLLSCMSARTNSITPILKRFCMKIRKMCCNKCRVGDVFKADLRNADSLSSATFYQFGHCVNIRVQQDSFPAPVAS